jgi:hypothetical protein
MENFLLDGIERFVGRTVTVFTESGGLSGSGFTGILASIDCNSLRLITQVGAAPSCAIGSSCSNGLLDNCNNYKNCSNGYYHNNWLGSVTVIPLCKIVSFTHNAV